MTPLPRWAVWLDGLAIIFLCIAAKVALSHDVRFTIGTRLLTIGDPWRPAIIGLVLLTVRHWRVPAPNLLQRIAAFLGRWSREPRATVVRVWAVSRFGVLLAGLLAALIIGPPEGMTQRISDDPVLDLPARWDVAWYSGIAREGYGFDARGGETTQQSIAFFPAYPMILRAVDVFTQPERSAGMSLATYLEIRESRLVWVGTAISIACFLGALFLLYRWVEARSGHEAGAAAIVLVSAYPFAVFYSAPYTESLFLLAAVGACFAFERERWWTAGLFGLLAGFTRPNGCMLSVTLAILAVTPLFKSRRERSPARLLLALFVAAMPGIAMLIHSAFIYSLTGDPFAWMKVQQAWGRNFASTMEYVRWTTGALRDHGILFYVRSAPVAMLQTVAAAFALAMVWPVWRRLGFAYAVFMLANLLPPLFKGGVLSMGRMTSTAFPMFVALALMIPPERRGAWILLFGLGQGLIAALFYTWRPVY